MIRSFYKSYTTVQDWITKKEIPQTSKNNLPQIDSKFLLQIAQQMEEKEKLIELQSEKIEVLQIENTKQVDENQKLKITDCLNQKKWLCKGEHNSNKATAESCRIGWFVNDISIYEVNGRKKTSEYGKFTVEGLVGIYDTFKKPAELNK